MLNDPVLILNKSWIPISIVTLRKALILTYRGTAQIICVDTYMVFDFSDWLHQKSTNKKYIQGVSVEIPAMEVIVLHCYNKIPKRKLAFSKENLFQRDKHICQYCMAPYPYLKLTIDHVIPKSKGGKTEWSNCVTACQKCNRKKGDLLLKESHFTLEKQPYRPKWNFQVAFSKKTFKESWKSFLGKNKRLA